MHLSGLKAGAFGFQTRKDHPMRARLPASDRIRKRVANVLSGDFDKSEFLRSAVRSIIEEALEAEVADTLGRAYYERGEPAG